jgi:hypothetical protein
MTYTSSHKKYPTYLVTLPTWGKYKIVFTPSLLPEEIIQLYKEPGVITVDINSIDESSPIHTYLTVFGVI